MPEDVGKPKEGGTDTPPAPPLGHTPGPWNPVGPCTPKKVSEERTACDDFYDAILPDFLDLLQRRATLDGTAKDYADELDAYEQTAKAIDKMLADYYQEFSDYVDELHLYEMAAAGPATQHLWDWYSNLCGEAAGIEAEAMLIFFFFIAPMMDVYNRLVVEAGDFDKAVADYVAFRDGLVAEMSAFLKTLICTRCASVDLLEYRARLLRTTWTLGTPSVPPGISWPPAPNPPGGGQQAPPPKTKSKKKKPVPLGTSASPQPEMYFSGVDWENDLDDALPLQFVRVVVRAPSGGPQPDDADGVWVTSGTDSMALPLTQVEGSDEYWVTDLFLLKAPEAETDADFAVAACAGSPVYAAIMDPSSPVWPLDASLDVTDPLEEFQIEPCAGPPDVPEVTLAAESSTDVSIDPQTLPYGAPAPDAPLLVRLTDHDGVPIEGEQVAWRIVELGLSFDSYTDKVGHSRFDFALVSRGRFAAVIDGLPVKVDDNGQQVDLVMVDGKYTIEACTGMALSAVLMNTDPVKFTVDLVKPTVVRILESTSGDELSELWSDQKFKVQVMLGRAAKQGGPVGSIPISLTSSTGATTTVTAKPLMPTIGIYQTSVLLAVKPYTIGKGDIAVEDGGTLKATAKGSGVAVPFYVTPLKKQVADLTRVIGSLNDGLAAVAANPAGVPAANLPAVLLKAKVAANGKAWMAQTFPTLSHQLAVAQVYVKLLTSGDDLGLLKSIPATSAQLPKILQKTGIVFACRIEAKQVVDVLTATTKQVITKYLTVGMVGVPQEVLNTLKALRDAFSSWDNIRDALAAPLLGGYTAITGYCANGEEATLQEKIVGGTQALAALLPSSFGGAWLGGRLLSTARTAIAITRRLSVIAPLALQTGIGVVTSGAEGVAVAAAMLKQILKDANRLDRRAEKFIEIGARTQMKVQALIDKWDEVGREVADLEKQLAQASTKAARADLASRILELNTRRDLLRSMALKHWERLAKTQRSFSAYLRNLVSNDEARALLKKDPKWAPDPHQWLNGRLAHAHFEAQVQDFLSPQGFAKGKGVKLHTAHYTPLYTGPVPTRPKYFGQIVAPRMDHMHLGTNVVADSKYYFFKNATKGLKLTEDGAKAAAEIADTIEKGRLVQAQRLFGVQASGLIGKVPLDKTKLQHLFDLKIRIFTPVPVPTLVKTKILKLVGKQCAKNVSFEVLPPDISSWLAKQHP